MRAVFLLCLFTLAAAARGADTPPAADAVGAGEFPGLQFLPPGSEIEDISLPRYDKHRVSALLQARKLVIVSRSTVRLEGITASMYHENGSATEIRTEAAEYDFTTRRASSAGSVSMKDPRFSAEGQKLYFNTEKNRGILLGPVRTTLSASLFEQKKAAE